MGRLEEAARAAGTALYMMPADQEMRNNVEFYREEAGDRDWLQPREEAVKYVHRDNDEESLLTFIETQFTFNRKEERAKESLHLQVKVI